MRLDIKVISVDAEQRKTKGGKPYDALIVTFTNLQSGRVENKTIFPFGSKVIYDLVRDFEKGGTYSIETEKGASGYWDWIEVSRQDGVTMEKTSAATSGYAASPRKENNAVPSAGRPQYETADERALKQVYIIKQSSLATAVNLLKTEKVQPSPQEVIAVAQAFTDWVMSKPAPMDDISDLDDDIPL